LEHSNADLILGRPWERAVRASYINEDNGSYTVRIKSPDGHREVKFCAVKAEQHGILQSLLKKVPTPII
jgi:hypothetical protein